MINIPWCKQFREVYGFTIFANAEEENIPEI